MLRGYVDSPHTRKNPNTRPSGPKGCWRFIVWALGLTSSAYPETGWIPRAQRKYKQWTKTVSSIIYNLIFNFCLFILLKLSKLYFYNNDYFAGCPLLGIQLYGNNIMCTKHSKESTNKTQNCKQYMKHNFFHVISSFYVQAMLRKYISYQDFHMQELDYSYKLRILFLIINPWTRRTILHMPESNRKIIMF